LAQQAAMRKSLGLVLTVFAIGCAGPQGGSPNPFLQNMDNDGKEDSAYMNPDGVEIEVDIEGDVEGPSWRRGDGPAEIGQYALTYFRERSKMYIESLAEDSTADDRAEWLIDGTWYTAANVPAGAPPKHFRLRRLHPGVALSRA